MQIRLDVEGTVLTATLDETEAARDFASLLPLTLTLSDYAATEKVADLPRRLATTGAPPGAAAAAGDVSYYAPWGNLALFHRPFGYSAGLVKLGALNDGVETLRPSGPLTAMIELLER
jgi:hypothetical protein